MRCDLPADRRCSCGRRSAPVLAEASVLHRKGSWRVVCRLQRAPGSVSGTSACGSCVPVLATARKRLVDRPCRAFLSPQRAAAGWCEAVRAIASIVHRKGSWRVVCRLQRAPMSVSGASACGSCVPVLATARKRSANRASGAFLSPQRAAAVRVRGRSRHGERCSPEGFVACRLSTGASAGERERRIGVPFVRGSARHSAQTQRAQAFAWIPLAVARTASVGRARAHWLPARCGLSRLRGGAGRGRGRRCRRR